MVFRHDQVHQFETDNLLYYSLVWPDAVAWKFVSHTVFAYDIISISNL